MDISYDQNIAIIEAMEDGETREAYLAEMEQWLEYYSAFLDLPDDEAKNTLIPNAGGTFAYYWKDLYANPISGFVEKINAPFLIMQGTKDFQIFVDKDYAAWQELLAGRNNVTFKLYEGLNHMFMASVTGDIEEYKIKSSVDGQVLQDIVDWIKSY
jgi:hypothetical protein